MDQSNHPTTPAALRLTGACLCALTSVWAIVGVVITGLALARGAGSGSVGWMLAFEAIIAMTTALCAWWCLGASRSSHAMALLVGAGTIFAGSLLPARAVVAGFLQGGTGLSPFIAGIDVRVWALARVADSVVLLALCALVVLSLRPGASVRLLLKGALIGAPAVGILALWFVPAVRQSFSGVPAPVKLPVAALVFIVFAVFVSVGGHHLIRAFEVGLEYADGREDGETGATEKTA